MPGRLHVWLGDVVMSPFLFVECRVVER